MIIQNSVKIKGTIELEERTIFLRGNVEKKKERADISKNDVNQWKDRFENET